MQTNNVTRITRRVKLACALLLAMFSAQTSFIHSFAAPQARPAQTGELKSAAEAKRALARLGTANFARIKDARKREAAQKAYDAIKALANNTSSEREATLAANLEQATLAIKAFPRPKNASFQQCEGSYNTCMELCKETGGNCKYCAISNNMCYDIALVLEWLNEQDPTKN